MAMAAAESGRIIAQSAEGLLRIWRLARATARRDVFPGLLDGIVGQFFERAGRLLAAGAAPEEAWRGIVGPLRWSPRAGARELTGEWAIAMEVLAAACESFDAAPEVASWMARAVAEGERSTATLERSEPKLAPGVLVVHVLGELRPPPRFEAEEEQDA